MKFDTVQSECCFAIKLFSSQFSNTITKITLIFFMVDK